MGQSTAFLPLYVGDYHRDTAHLSTEEHGAYLLILMAMWSAGGRLPNDDSQLARIAGFSAFRFRKFKNLLMGFCEIRDGFLTNKRITSELGKVRRISDMRSEAGRKGAAGKHGNCQNGDVAIATHPQPHKKEEPVGSSKDRSDKSSLSFVDSLFGDGVPPAPVAKRKPRAKAPDTYDPLFEEAWKAYPHVPGRSTKPEAYEAWKAFDAETKADLPAAVKRFAPHSAKASGDKGAQGMERWLTRGRHADWVQQVRQASGGPVQGARRFPGPDPLRVAVAAAMGEPWTASHLDLCDWDGEKRLVLAPTRFLTDRLSEEIGSLLRRGNVTIERKP